MIADLGLYTISVREISAHKDDPEKVRHIAGNILALRTLMGLAIIAISLLLGAFLPGYDTKIALVGIAIAGVFTLSGLVNSSILSMLQAYLKTEFSFVSTTAGKIVNLLAILAAAFLILPKPFSDGTFLSLTQTEWSFVLVMVAGLLGNIVMTAMLYFYSRTIEKVGFRFDPEYIKNLIRETFPYGLALFLNVIFFKVDVILLSFLEPREHADSVIALYSVPMKIVEVGMMFGTVFLNSMLPLFTQAIGKKDELAKLVGKAYGILLFFGVGLAVFLAVNPAEVLRLIANESYLVPIRGQTSADALSIVSFIFLFYFVSSLFTYLLIASGKQKRLLRINAVIAGANLVFNCIAIPYYSFIGSAYVTLLSQILLFALTVRATRDILPFGFAPEKTVPVLLGSGIAGYLLVLLSPSIRAFGF